MASIFGDINTISGIGFDPFNSNYANGVLSNGLTITQATQATQAQKQAAAAGNTQLANIFAGVLKFGLPLLTVLTSSGILKDKNRIAIAEIQSGQLAQFQSLNSGVDFTQTNPNQLRSANANNPLGIDSSTLLLVGLGVLIYTQLK
jgi:hypothetical protein